MSEVTSILLVLTVSSLSIITSGKINAGIFVRTSTGTGKGSTLFRLGPKY